MQYHSIDIHIKNDSLPNSNTAGEVCLHTLFHEIPYPLPKLVIETE